jgi:hypothetical protein
VQKQLHTCVIGSLSQQKNQESFRALSEVAVTKRQSILHSPLTIGSLWFVMDG